jgi:hypothetical protein
MPGGCADGRPCGQDSGQACRKRGEDRIRRQGTPWQAAPAAGEGPLPTDQVNLTDEESRIMPVAGGGFEQCDNAHAVVAEGSLLVVAADMAQADNGKQQLQPMLKALRAAARSGMAEGHRVAARSVLDDGGHNVTLVASRDHSVDWLRSSWDGHRVFQLNNAAGCLNDRDHVTHPDCGSHTLSQQGATRSQSRIASVRKSTLLMLVSVPATLCNTDPLHRAVAGYGSGLLQFDHDRLTLICRSWSNSWFERAIHV